MEVCGLEKKCYRCQVVKPLEAYYNHKGRPHNKANECRDCCLARQRSITGDKRREYNRKRRESGAQLESTRKHLLKKLYGISVEQFTEMLTRQNGVCKICHKPESKKKNRLHVDHCHTTGRVRGLLCSKCNAMLGMCGDSAEVLRNAIGYLSE